MIRKLLRFYAARRTAAILVGGVTAWLSIQLFSGPPEFFAEWPPQARRVLMGLVSGTLAIGFAGWVLALLMPVLKRRDAVSWVAHGVMAVVLISSLDEAIELIKSVGSFPRLERNGLRPVVTNWARAAGAPVFVGALPLMALEAYERLTSEPVVRRLFGRGHAARCAGPYIIARYTEPLPARPPQNGFYTDGFLAGKVLGSDNDGSQQMIVDRSPAHWCWFGGPGSGKNICSAQLAGYRGSLIHASNKSDACDLYFGARIDQERLRRIDCGQLREKRYTDTRGITSTTRWIDNGRGIVIDYANQSVYPSKKHTLISDIDINDCYARVLALAIADGFFPDVPGSKKDSWYIQAPRNFMAAGILHFLSWRADPRTHNLPYVVERGMGFDALSNEAGPKVMQKLLDEMLRNNHPQVGAFIRTTAVQVLELGSRSYGTLKSEYHNNCAALYDPQLRELLIGESDCSYRDIGIDGAPFTMMHVLPRGDAALRAAIPIFRAHVELAMQIQQTKLDRPAIPTALVVDEARQFLSGIQCVTKAPMLLRDARIRMWQIYQSWQSAVETLGESGALEMEACSVCSYFGLDGDLTTAKRVSERLGRESYRVREGLFSRRSQRVDAELMTPERIMKELSIRSPLAYLMGPGMEPMRVERLAFKPLVTREGCHFRGLPMAGQYDEGLSRYHYGDGTP